MDLLGQLLRSSCYVLLQCASVWSEAAEVEGKSRTLRRMIQGPNHTINLSRRGKDHKIPRVSLSVRHTSSPVQPRAEEG
jgi:hypothetical protein